MSWLALPPSQRDLAIRVCTRRQVDALRAYFNANGQRRTAARDLGIDRRTLDAHITAAMTRVIADSDFDPAPWIAAAHPDTENATCA